MNLIKHLADCGIVIVSGRVHRSDFARAAIVLASETLTLWHGGNLDTDKEYVAQKGGRWENGPGLYLTTHYGTAKKYAKGSRKLYKVVIRKGTDIGEVRLNMPNVVDFIDEYVPKAKSKDVLNRITKRSSGDKVDADVFLNIMINEQAIKSTGTGQLRKFLVDNGVDYSIQDNAFGWHERMVVLFNMKNLVSKTVVKPSDDIEIFDLPTQWQ